MNHSSNSPSIRYSRNRLANREVIKKLVDRSSISKGDLVYDIGTGAGPITAVLLDKGARVIAIEKDPALYLKCRQRFPASERLHIYNADFLAWEFPPGQKYKVFANIPFFHTAEIIKKLLLNKSPPEDCYLIVQREAAEKYAGIPADTLVSLLIKPFFWVEIISHLDRTDFRPVPAVDTVLLQFERRKCRLVSGRLYRDYKDLIIYCREGPHRTIKQALKRFFTYPRLKEACGAAGIDLRASPAALSFRQYLCLFQFYVDGKTGKDRIVSLRSQ